MLKELEEGKGLDACDVWNKEVIREEQLHRPRWRASEATKAERRKRITVLRTALELGIRTDEEERRLAVIRARLGKMVDDPESWTVVIASSGI